MSLISGIARNLNHAPLSVSAWMCSCYKKSVPDLHAAYHFCQPGSGHKYCVNKTTNVQACIMGTPITQANCASSYGSDWVAECEHYTGGCPPGMTEQ
ncbi:hypothetical protein HER10_EVM0005355 [Colletotrichum scovillei]|nr:uncharacterized protein HER10_EVM0005355 [Colletotrichum scovillei]KAF4783021.1 hypothetical protein HER10_EVM0005355 [Colletotrichum scovillei]